MTPTIRTLLILARAAALTLPLLCAAPALARAGDATRVIRKANDRFQELLARQARPGSPEEKQLTETMTKELRDLFDIRDLARRALVDHWDGMKPAERDEVVLLLQKLVEKNYVKSLRSRLKVQVDYKVETPQGDTVLVRTVVRAEKKGRPVDIAVDYVLGQDAAGAALRVFDVVTDDVSMLKNYRSQFNRIIAKEGVAGLLARMRAKDAKAKTD